MKPSNLQEIWDAEDYYEQLRWSPKRPLEELDLEILLELREDVQETIKALNGWLRRRLRPHNRRKIERFKAKLIDFRWRMIQQIQKQEQRKKHFERLEELQQPRPRDTSSPVRLYGLRSPLKGSKFYRIIPRTFAPRLKEAMSP